MDNEQLGHWGQAAANFTGMLKDSMSVFVEPAKMKRIHKAEMEIREDDLRQACRLEEMSIRERARLRALKTELRRQANLEEIGTRALNMLSETATPECIDVDWINTFASCAEDVGEDELKSLWASILSNEAQSPGKYSKRTLNALKNFDVKDCKMCEEIAPYMFEIFEKEGAFCGMFWDKEIQEKIPYSTASHLESIGIIYQSTLGITFTAHPGENVLIKYQNEKNKFVNSTDKDVEIGDLIGITEAGKQIISIINYSHNDEYRSKVINSFKRELTEINE